MRFSDPEMPFIGKGCWVMPLYLLKDKKVMSQVYSLSQKVTGNGLTASDHVHRLQPPDGPPYG
jgi:hypothetical protein